MAVKINKGRGSADLLLEIVLSAIIFFIVTIIIFGLQLPKQEFKARAQVVSADSSVACELSLINLMRAQSSQSINYNDWLINTQVQNADLSAWQAEVRNYFDKAFSTADRWDMNVTLANGTTLLNMGKINEDTPEEAIFTCMYYVPYPAAYSKYFCFPDIQEAKDLTSSNKIAKFKAEGEDVECTISIKPRLEIKEDVTKCKLDLIAKNPFEEDLLYFIDNTPDVNDTLILPIKVAGTNYEIILYETIDQSMANAALVKSSLLKDCSLHVILRTTNISAQI